MQNSTDWRQPYHSYMYSDVCILVPLYRYNDAIKMADKNNSNK